LNPAAAGRVIRVLLRLGLHVSRVRFGTYAVDVVTTNAFMVSRRSVLLAAAMLRGRFVLILGLVILLNLRL
jgi:hypothetical protein